jgi:hypothetical protein
VAPVRFRRKVWWPGLAVACSAFIVGVALALSGRPGIGYAVILAVLAFTTIVGLLSLALIRARRP